MLATSITVSKLCILNSYSLPLRKWLCRRYSNPRIKLVRHRHQISTILSSVAQRFLLTNMEIEMSENDSVPMRLKSVAEAAKEIGISPAGMRWIRFKASAKRSSRSTSRVSNGFTKAFVKIGRRVFVDMDAFYRCVAEQNGVLLEIGRPDCPGRGEGK